MSKRLLLPVTFAVLVLAACGERREHEAATPSPARAPAAARAPRTAGDRDFPAIPTIVVPDIVGVTPAQQALQRSLRQVIDPMAGISVRPARCNAGRALIDARGITLVDGDGAVTRNGDAGVFHVNPDGSGTANFEGGVVTVNADGSGTINSTGDDGAVVQVHADGSGTYNGPAGVIVLDGRGGGTWNGPAGVVRNNGDGSGTWNGPLGTITVNADGSGTWNGDGGLVRNFGNGRGTVGTPPRTVAMAPLPPVPRAGRFAPLRGFALPGTACGFVITLEDRVLFDFDRAEIRADAARVLDALAGALAQVDAASLDIRGHTDALGTDAYNLDLSRRRAEAVARALQVRGAATRATTHGLGESQPVAPNTLDGHDNPAGRQANRRVEIVVRT